MKIVQVDELSFQSRADLGRGGSGHKARTVLNSDVLGRDPDRADNFYFGLSSSAEGEFSSPRHRHVFDQFRYMIDGEGDYPEGLMTAGVLGYFPQGAYYGPQERLYGTLFILQFGGPSGHGYLDRKQIQAASAEMKAAKAGYFEGGTYYRERGAGGFAAQDAHEAIYEHVRKRPVEYPAPQYISPVLIDTNAFPWMPVEGAPGLYEKALGTFTSCRYGVARYKLEPGAELAAAGRGVYVVLSGSGTVEGEAARQYTTLYLEDGERGRFTADLEMDVLVLGLPSLSLMQAQRKPMGAAA